jgi:hypothetical protein
MTTKTCIGIIFFATVSISVFGNTWEFIKEKTWSTKDFPTMQIVFYETENGLKKGIYQINGSGRCAVLSVIYDIDLKGDTIYLKDGMNLEPHMQSKKRGGEFLLFQTLCLNETILISENLEFNQISDTPLICNWLETYSGNNTIPIEKLKAIPIQEKMIYDKHSANFGPNPENCGIDDKPLLTEEEATFLNEYLKHQARQKDFDFNNKRIVFITGSGGNVLGSKSAYFNDIKKWKETYNSKIASSLIVLSEQDKAEYGYDAILTYWVKVITPKGNQKVLKRTKEKE